MVNKLWFLAFIALWFNNNFILCDVIPTLNLDALGGELGFIGDYAGLSPIKSLSQFESLPPNNHGLIISDTIDDINIFNLFATINGTIESYCQLTDNQYILAGNFDTINGTTYNHIAQFDITSKQLSPLQQGLDGPVRSIYCTDTNIIYVGGDFIAPRAVTNTTAYTGHVALWQNNQWSPVPWKGLNGPVYSIIQHGQSILFGGHFDSTGDGKFASLNTSQTINLASSAVRFHCVVLHVIILFNLLKSRSYQVVTLHYLEIILTQLVSFVQSHLGYYKMVYRVIGKLSLVLLIHLLSLEYRILI